MDFVNDYEDIKSAFAPYYTTTLLANTITPNAIYDLEAKIDAYAVIDPMDVDNCNALLYKEKVDGKDKQKMTFYFKKAKSLIEHYTPEQQTELVGIMRSFVRFYEFLLQVSCFEDVELHKKYNFINCLLSYININHPGGGYNLDGKIKATNFVQKKGEEHKQSNLVSDPIVKLPTADAFGLTKECYFLINVPYEIHYYIFYGCILRRTLYLLTFLSHQMKSPREIVLKLNIWGRKKHTHRALPKGTGQFSHHGP